MKFRKVHSVRKVVLCLWNIPQAYVVLPYGRNGPYGISHDFTYSAARLGKKGSTPPHLECTQQAYGEKASFAWTGNFLKMTFHAKKIISFSE